MWASTSPTAVCTNAPNSPCPLLRDAYLREMLTYAPTLAAGQPPSPDVIGAMLQRATDRTLGRPGAKLLLGAILIN